MKQQSILNFQVLVTQDEDGVFVADVPAIPGCHSQGKTYEKAIQNVTEAIQLCLSVAQGDGDFHRRIDWPEDSKTPKLLGVVNVPISTPAVSL